MTTTNRFAEALDFTARVHAAQKRKGTDIPYVSHLLAVASLVMESGGGEDEAIAGLLHDAIEDQARHYAGGIAQLRCDIAGRFGPAVLAIVEGCTDTVEHPKPAWRLRKERYIAHLAGAPVPVRLVSCADKLHNARAILADYRAHGEDLWSRFNAGREDVLWYYRSLASELTAAGPHGLAGELSRTVEALERLVRENGPRATATA